MIAGHEALTQVSPRTLLEPNADVSPEVRAAVGAVEAWFVAYDAIAARHGAAEEATLRGGAEEEAAFEAVDAEFIAFLETFAAVTDRLAQTPARSSDELIAKTTAFLRAHANYFVTNRAQIDALEAIDQIGQTREPASLCTALEAILADLSTLSRRSPQ